MRFADFSDESGVEFLFLFFVIMVKEYSLQPEGIAYHKYIIPVKPSTNLERRDLHRL